MRYSKKKDKARPQTSTRNSVFDKKRLTHSKSVIGNLKRAQADGLYKTDYVTDHPIHFTNPPYVLIKPNYRPQIPVNVKDTVGLKHMYSFDKFGHPNGEWKALDPFETAFRQT